VNEQGNSSNKKKSHSGKRKLSRKQLDERTRKIIEGVLMTQNRKGLDNKFSTGKIGPKLHNNQSHGDFYKKSRSKDTKQSIQEGNSFLYDNSMGKNVLSENKDKGVMAKRSTSDSRVKRWNNKSPSDLYPAITSKEQNTAKSKKELALILPSRKISNRRNTLKNERKSLRQENNKKTSGRKHISSEEAKTSQAKKANRKVAIFKKKHKSDQSPLLNNKETRQDRTTHRNIESLFFENDDDSIRNIFDGLDEETHSLELGKNKIVRKSKTGGIVNKIFKCMKPPTEF